MAERSTAAVDVADNSGDEPLTAKADAATTDGTATQDTEGPEDASPNDADGGRDSAESVPASPDLHSGHKLARRYRLEECVTRLDGFSSWRAVDEKLRRAVGVHLLPADHPRARSVLAAARSSALLGDPRFVQVLDAVEEDDLVYVVHEWLPDATELTALLAAGLRGPRRLSAREPDLPGHGRRAPRRPGPSAPHPRGRTAQLDRSVPDSRPGRERRSARHHRRPAAAHGHRGHRRTPLRRLDPALALRERRVRSLRAPQGPGPDPPGPGAGGRPPGPVRARHARTGQRRRHRVAPGTAVHHPGRARKGRRGHAAHPASGTRLHRSARIPAHDVPAGHLRTPLGTSYLGHPAGHHGSPAPSPEPHGQGAQVGRVRAAHRRSGPRQLAAGRDRAEPGQRLRGAYRHRPRTTGRTTTTPPSRASPSPSWGLRTTTRSARTAPRSPPR